MKTLKDVSKKIGRGIALPLAIAVGISGCGGKIEKPIEGQYKRDNQAIWITPIKNEVILQDLDGDQIVDLIKYKDGKAIYVAQGFERFYGSYDTPFMTKEIRDNASRILQSQSNLYQAIAEQLYQEEIPGASE